MTIAEQTIPAAEMLAGDVIGYPAPDVKGIASWLNTPGGAPICLASLRGSVVLVDFWAYSCINSRRALAHVVDWYETYKDFGLQVVGIHSPEYAFEKLAENVARCAAGLSITYPIALDNNMSTWNNYRNRHLPAQYLIDTDGIVRHIKFGEGDYRVTENLIRTLLVNSFPAGALPPASVAADSTPRFRLTPETTLSVGKALSYGGTTPYDQGEAAFDYPAVLPEDSFAYRGPWTLDYQGATAGGETSSIVLNYCAKNVYLVAGGNGTMTVTRGGHTATLPISGPPNLHQIADGDATARDHLEVRLTKGLKAFSFTYG